MEKSLEYYETKLSNIKDDHKKETKRLKHLLRAEKRVEDKSYKNLCSELESLVASMQMELQNE